MKKKTTLLSILFLCFSIKAFSLDNTKIKQLIKEIRETDSYFITNIYHISNEYSIALIRYEDVDAYKIYIFSNSDFKTVDIDSNKGCCHCHGPEVEFNLIYSKSFLGLSVNEEIVNSKVNSAKSHKHNDNCLGNGRITSDSGICYGKSSGTYS